jgi:signal transduction histidine kinase
VKRIADFIRLFSVSLVLLTAYSASAQNDTAQLKRMYGRAMRLTEADADSIRFYADFISQASRQSKFPPARVMALRLYGFYFENKGDYGKAIDYYLQALTEAKNRGDIEHEINALTDLAVVYTSNMKQPQKAKELYLACVELNRQQGDGNSLLSSYVNLGAIYDRLGLYDSALYFLEEGMKIGKPLEAKDSADLTSLYNNLGNTYYYRRDFDKAIFYFRKNYSHNQAKQGLGNGGSAGEADLWFDVLNLSDTYIEKGAFDSAEKYGNLALQFARSLESRSKLTDSYQNLAKLFQRKGNYRKAWEYQSQWYQLDTALVNGETYKTIAELEKKYESRQRENEKRLLEAEISEQRLNNRFMMIMAIGLLLLAITAALAFVVKRRANRKLVATNDLIVRQNERLAELNYEKNSLISIVSHDLSTPFASIAIWNRVMLEDRDRLSSEQQRALDRIGKAAKDGEVLIRHILDVEKAETNQQKVQLENVDLVTFAAAALESFRPVAEDKQIRMTLDAPKAALPMLTDRKLLGRILDNLLSNAIKYTPRNREVRLTLGVDNESVIIQVADEGVGIAQDELPLLFGKYSRLSSQPTNGEPTNGLGLAIVKRICEELNGRISCESTVGQGSVFTVSLKK